MLQLNQSFQVWSQHYACGLCWSFLCSAYHWCSSEPISFSEQTGELPRWRAGAEQICVSWRCSSRTGFCRQPPTGGTKLAAFAQPSLTSQSRGGITEEARFAGRPWASCAASNFPIQQSRLCQNQKTTCQFPHVPLNTALAFDRLLVLSFNAS